MGSAAGFRITTNAKEYLRKLEKIEGGLQKAVARTLNTVSTAAAGRQLGNIRRDMIIRNQYTEKSLRHYKASESKPIARQNAIVGTVSPYLPLQEKGGVIRAKRKAIPIPTNALRGSDRKKAVAPRYRMNRLGQLGESGSRFFIIRSGSRSGIFYRKSKRKLVKVRDLSVKSYRLRARKWHSEAVKHFGTYAMYNAAFIREGKRILSAYTK